MRFENLRELREIKANFPVLQIIMNHYETLQIIARHFFAFLIIIWNFIRIFIISKTLFEISVLQLYVNFRKFGQICWHYESLIRIFYGLREITGDYNEFPGICTALSEIYSTESFCRFKNNDTILSEIVSIISVEI